MFETLVRVRLLPWEKELGSGITGSDAGPFLLSMGWDYTRIIGISTLGDWHRYVRQRRSQAFWSDLEGVVTQSKEIILAPLPELSVR